MDTSQNKQATDYTCSFHEIFRILRDKLHLSSAEQFAILEEQIALKLSILFSIRSDTKEKLRKAINRIHMKWKEAYRREDRFLKKNETWLDTAVTIFNSTTQSSTAPAPSVDTGKRGRRRNSSFEESSRRTQKRIASDISETHSTDQLALATRISLISAGRLDAASIVKDITTKSSVRATKYRAAFITSMEPLPIEMSGDDALVDFIDAKLTKQQYKYIRKSLRQKKYTVYPSYEKVAAAKKLCYPSHITINETSAEVNLQSLLDHTCSRILQLQTDVITFLRPEVTRNLRLLCKWGCDGSSGHSSDASVFLTSLVPLKIIGSDNEVIWKNPRPSSPRYCRPIRVQFLKETIASTNLERDNVQDQINSLVPFTTIIDANDVIVKYELFFTMIKDIKKYRECYARKNSRTATMEDIFNRLLLTSDPYMSSIGKRYPKKGKNLVPEALQLLLGTDSSREKFGLQETSEYSTDESESNNSSEDDD